MVSDSELLKRLLEHDFSVFKDQTQRYLSADRVLKKMISKEQQEKTLETLRVLSNFDHFYFITSILDNELGANHAVGKFLGYPAEEFTMKKYLNIIHPKHLLPRNLFVYFWREQLLAGNFKIKYMDHRLITRLAVKDRDGKYVLVKYMSFAFQLDDKNRVFEYSNLATVLHDFNDEPYSFLINDEKGNRMTEWEEKIKGDVKQAFLNSGLFSEMQTELLKYVSNNRSPDFKLSEIAVGLNEHEEHIKTQCRRTKEKINELFNTDFTETRTAFSYLLTQGLI